MFGECLIDLPYIDDKKNCSYYLENDFFDFDCLCHNCKVNLLKFVSVRFLRIFF